MLKKALLILLFSSFLNVYANNNYDISEEKQIEEIASKNIEYPHYEVGSNFLSGKKIEKDYEKALFWLARSSEIEEYNKADYLIAEMFVKGLNKNQEINYEKAVFFYERAAKRGNKDAKLKLAAYYLFNDYLFDKDKALYWIDQSIKDDNEMASMLLYLVSLNKNDYDTIRKEINLLKLRSSHGDSLSSFALGYLYLAGKGVEHNLIESKNYFVLSMLSGNIISEILINQINKLDSSN